jgi:hypothetical protein
MAGVGLAVGIGASALAQPAAAPWQSDSVAQPVGQRPTVESELPAQASPAPNAQPVIDAQQVQTITRQFQTALNRLGGVPQITRCGPVLQLVTPQTGGYDQSYGAICDLQVAEKRAQAVMCDDQRSGKFTLTLATIRDLDSVRRFITDNCFPDG